MRREIILFVTPCSRPENLEKIHGEIVRQSRLNARVVWNWYIALDGRNGLTLEDVPRAVRSDPNTKVCVVTDPNSIMGTAQRNSAMDMMAKDHAKLEESAVSITNAWVYFLDDDNLPPQKLFSYIEEQDLGGADFLLLPQRREGIGVASFTPAYVKQWGMDTGMGVYRLCLVHDLRWISRIDHDGVFSRHALSRAKNIFVAHRLVASYNALGKSLVN